MSIARQGRRAAAVLFALAACSLSIAAETAPLDSIREDLAAMQKLLKNTKVRLEHIAGAKRGTTLLQSKTDASTVKRPVVGCCSKNLEAIDGRVQSILASLRELDRRHADANDPAGRESLAHMAETLREFARSQKALTESSEKRAAEITLKVVTGHFNHLRRDADEYEECCAANLPSEPAPAKKKRKSRRSDGT